MRDLDTAPNSTCEWAVSSPRRLTLILIALIVAPHIAEGFLL